MIVSLASEEHWGLLPGDMASIVLQFTISGLRYAVATSGSMLSEFSTTEPHLSLLLCFQILNLISD